MRGFLATSVFCVALGVAPSALARSTTPLDLDLFTARLHGPFAPSVRDQLNEMVIQTHLKAFGIEPGDDMPLTRAGLLSAIPSHLPAGGYVSSKFGIRRSPFTRRLTRHAGVDIAARYGSPVFATADGIVTYSGWRKALGRTVVINHGYGIVTKYGHNSALKVKVGDVVTRGMTIASVGASGRATGAHLHYEVWINGKVVDPAQFMFDVPELDPSVSETYVRIPMAPPTFGGDLAMGGDEELVGPGADLAVAADAHLPLGGELTFSDAPEIHASQMATPAQAGGSHVNLLVVLLLALSSGGVVFAAARR
jgi:hypothetical protein